jgi:hypothetical protein
MKNRLKEADTARKILNEVLATGKIPKRSVKNN